MHAEPATVLVERRGNTAVVTLNRLAALNAVSAEMREALVAALAGLNSDSAVRAVAITGAGERAFCSGQDLNETARYTVDDVEHWLTRLHAMYRAVRDLDKPSIAAWNGVAAGAGYQIGLCCDLRVGFPEMKLGQPEIRAGLASIVGSYLMTMHLGLSQNVQMSLTGKAHQRPTRWTLDSSTTSCHGSSAGAITDPRRRICEAGANLGPTDQAAVSSKHKRVLTALAAAKKAQREAYLTGSLRKPCASFWNTNGTPG
jgi:hypothetical protein